MARSLQEGGMKYAIGVALLIALCLIVGLMHYADELTAQAIETEERAAMILLATQKFPLSEPITWDAKVKQLGKERYYVRKIR